MNLVETKHAAREPRNRHEGHHTQSFLKNFWISAILSIPVIAYSDLPRELFSWQAPSFLGSEFIPVILGTVVFWYGGWIFLVSAWREVRTKAPGMMTLIALAISVAYGYSIYVVATGEGNTLFWELTTLIAVMLLGHWFEMKSVQSAQGALQELSKLLPDTAERLIDGTIETIPVSELQEGDIVLVRPGARVPADGIVKEGQSSVHEAMVTGESVPVRKEQTSEVIGGTINGDGSLTIRVSRVGKETFLAGVMRLVAEAQSSKSNLQLLADRAAFYLTLVAISTGAGTFLVWILVAAQIDFALERLVAVLVIACPHALGLAIPLVAAISTSKAARNGFLVRERLALELARNIDTVLFDKTGTLTTGEFGVSDVIALPDNPANAWDEKTILTYAASLEQYSEHSIANGIGQEAKKRGISLLPATGYRAIPGKGATALVDGYESYIGNREFLEELGWPVQGSQQDTEVYLVVDKELRGMIALRDLVREESFEAIQRLQEQGLEVAMITGDNEQVAARVANQLHMKTYFAKVLPQDKSRHVKKFQSQGKRVAFVGDGVNDAPALAQADLGIAIGAGTNVAIESAGIILVKNDPRDIAKIMRLSKMTYRKMIQNLFWATGYNVVAIPLAAGALASYGIFLQPAVGAVLMSASTVIVALNALLLRRKPL